MKLDGGNPALTAADGNKLGVDPMFVNAASGDFHVKAGSPAIDAGNSSYVVGTTDVDGSPRVVGTVDIGAYEQATTGSVNQPPVANPDSGFITTANTPITISIASLLANDTDADGNTLSLTGVLSASHGSAQIQGSNVIFTPDSGYTGAAGFNYSISDGKGGTASSSVGLTVNPASTNAAPTFTSGNAFSINENTKSVGTVTAKDAEGDALTFSKVGGSDAALFTIDAKTGAISFVNAPDFEKPAGADGNNVYLLNVGATDGNHSPVTSSLQISVKDVVETTTPPATGSSFFAPGAVPATTETKDTADYELGMKFTPLKNGEITGLRYYRGSADAGDTDTRTLHLWNSKGQDLGSVTVTSAPGARGWQTATLSTPVKVTAQSQYVVSYGTTQNYVETQKYFGSAMTNADGSLSVPAGADGVSTDSPTSGPDIIRDFVRGTDKIDLSAIDAVAGGADNAFTWIGSNAFSGAQGQLRIQSTSEGLILQGDYQRRRHGRYLDRAARILPHAPQHGRPALTPPAAARFGRPTSYAPRGDQTVIQRRTSSRSSSAVLPASTIRPRSITAIRSASSTAKSKNCSTSTIAMLPWSRR